MKDKLIQQKLAEYAEAVKPDSALIEAAVFELRRKRAEQASRSARRSRAPLLLRIGAAGVASLMLVVFSFYVIVNVFNFMGGNNDGTAPGHTPRYALSDLTYHVMPMENVRQESILILELDNVHTNARFFFEAGETEPILISVLYRTVGGGGIDEILILADIGGGLADFVDFRRHTATVIEGIAVHKRQILISGEFMTEAFFRYGDIDYYVKIMSPTFEAALIYLTLLLGG